MAEDILTGLDTPTAQDDKSVMDRIVEARQAKESLDREEAKSVPGAPTLMSKSILLDPKKAKAHPANKGMHLRWVNRSAPEKVESRKLEGYEVVPESEGGQTLGAEYVLMRLPADKAEAKRKALREKGRVWLAAHKSMVEQTAAEVAKILQDRYGFTSAEANILVVEQK